VCACLGELQVENVGEKAGGSEEKGRKRQRRCVARA
jgi:hypothetical protein